MTDTIDLSTLTDQQLKRLLSERSGPLLAELGRRAAARLPRYDRPCEACGEIMLRVTDKRRVCSESCRGRLTYWRHRAETDPGAVHRLRLEARGFLPDSRRPKLLQARARRRADLEAWTDLSRVPTLPPRGRVGGERRGSDAHG